MAFTFDTGLEPARKTYSVSVDPADLIADSLPADAPQHMVDAAVYRLVLAALHKPRRMDTIRRVLLTHWHVIAPLAEREPALFDHLLLTFAELSTERPG